MDARRERRRPITAEQWLAARAVSEGAMPTHVRVAAMLGCDVTAVYTHAAAEGWRRLDFRTSVAQEAHRDFIERVAAPDVADGFEARVENRVSTLSAQAEASRQGEEQERPSVEAGDDAAGPAGEAACGKEGSRGVENASCGETQGDGDDPLPLMARAAKLLARRLANLVARAEAGARLNKVEIDGLLALARMTERWETLAKERAEEEETQSDEEFARTLRKIDRRIIDLARKEAARLVAQDRGTEGGAAASG